MSVTLKKDSWKIKDGNGTYRESAIFSTTLPEDAAAIVAEATSAIDAQQIRATDIVDTATDEIDTIVQRVNDLVDTGTDTTLTQAGAAADAKAAGDKIGELRSAIDAVDDDVRNISYTWTDGYRIQTNKSTINPTDISPSASYSCIIHPCLKGEKYTISAKGNSTYHAYVLTDSSYAAYAICSSENLTNEEVTPTKDGFIICNTNTQSQKTLVKNEGYTSFKAEVQEFMSDVESDIADCLTAIPNIETLMFPESFFDQGTFGSNGSEADSPYAIRIKYKIPTTREVKLIPKSGYRVFVVKYSKDGVYESQTNWQTTAQTVSADKQFRFAISHTTITQETSVSEHGNVLAVNASYDEFLMHKTEEEANEYAWDIRKENLKYCANIFGTESNDHGAIYYVDPNGNEYTTISAAVTAWANDNYPAATIFIRNGEYNESITVEGKTIQFIGESRDGTILHTTTGNYTDPPINVRHGTVTVKNMTLIADHSDNPSFDYEASPYLKAYGIHIDGGEVGGIVTVENCTIISFQAPAVGTGTIPNSKIRLINCDCYCFTDYTSDTTSHQYQQLDLGCILWHTSNPENYPVRGDESFELVNVRAYMANNYVVLKTNRSDSGDSMDTLAINTLIYTNRNPSNQNPVSGPVHPVEGSIGNNIAKLNYSA